MSNPNANSSLDVVIDITKDAISSLDNVLNAQDTKGLFVAASATTIVALVAPSLANYPIWVRVLYVTSYVAVLIVSLAVYNPRVFRLSTADPVLAQSDFLSLPEHETKQHLLEILQTIYGHNYALMCKKGIWMKYSFYLLNFLILFSIVVLFKPILFEKDDDHAKQPSTLPKTKQPSVSGGARRKNIFANSANTKTIVRPR